MAAEIKVWALKMGERLRAKIAMACASGSRSIL